MNDDKVFRLLMETNPVPDPDGLDSPLALAELERRSPAMATRQPKSGSQRNGLLIPGWSDKPEHMAIAIEYVEEFVAQSDIYPIEPDGS